MSDEDVLNFLLKVKGIGEWSAHMFLMFGLGRRYYLDFPFIFIFFTSVYYLFQGCITTWRYSCSEGVQTLVSP